MKKIWFSKNFFAFSLAEALITLLIVCLITLASVPVLTKKRRQVLQSQTPGKWVCYWDNNDNLKSFYYIKGKITNGGEINTSATDIFLALARYNSNGVWKDAGCKFVPPPKAKNFVITYVGGGGGGAAGYSRVVSEKLDDGAIFTVPNDGVYAFLLSSAGGSGGDVFKYGTGTCDFNQNPYGSVSSSNKSCGSMGAPGGFIMHTNVNLKQNDKISVHYPISTWITACKYEIPDFGDATLSYNDKTVWTISSGQSGGCADYDGNNNWDGADFYYNRITPSTGSNSGALGSYLQTHSVYVYGGRIANETKSLSNSPFKVSDGGIVAMDKVSWSLAQNVPAWASANNASSNIDKSGSAYKYAMVADYKAEGYAKLFGFSSLQEFFGAYGYGGKGKKNRGDDNAAYTGGVGTARVAYVQAYSGRGGSAGTMKPPQIIASMDSKGIWAYPGKGGKGGTTTENAKAGGTTFVDRFPEALGGDGAPSATDGNKYCAFSNAGTNVAGCEGDRSQTYHTTYATKKFAGYALNDNIPNQKDAVSVNLFPVNKYFPHAAGSGGSGGGAGNADEISSEIFAGNGGRGASGAVIIEW